MNEKIKDVNNLEVGDFVSVFVRGSEISGNMPMLVIEKNEDKILGLNHTGSTHEITQEDEVTLQIPSHYVEDVYFNRLRQYLYTLKGMNVIEINKKIELLEDKSKISDGSHTFKELYHHRAILFSIICNTYKNQSWKSWKHDDGTMFEDYFVVGVTTEQGKYSYHYHKDYWKYFEVKELTYAPVWDGHKPSDIERLFTLL